MSVLVVAGSKTSTPNRCAPAYAAASARFFDHDRVRVGGAMFIDTVVAVFPRDGGPPPLQPLGQRVIGALLRHQAVADAGSAPGGYAAAQQPARRTAARSGPPQLRGEGPRRRKRRADWATASAGTANTSVGVARNASATSRARGQQRARSARRPRWHANVGGTVGVDVVAQHQRALRRRSASRRRPGCRCARSSARPDGEMAWPSRRRSRPAPGPRLPTGTSSVPPLRRAVSSTRCQSQQAGQVDPDHGDAPAPAAPAAGLSRRPPRAPRSSGPAAASHSGYAATVRTASAHDGSMTPPRPRHPGGPPGRRRAAAHRDRAPTAHRRLLRCP